jgi:hypothetical protein
MMSLTALSGCYSQTLADSIKRNIIEVGMRYDSLKRNYELVLSELKQREAEINQLNRVLEIERLEAKTNEEHLTQGLEISKSAMFEAIDLLKKQGKKKFVFGVTGGYGINDNGLGVMIGLGLTYKLVSF